MVISTVDSRARSRATLGRRIEEASARGGHVTFVGGGAVDRCSWAELHDDARGVAARLQALGVAPGDHVALLGTTSRAFVTAIQATWLAGAATVVLPLPLRMGSLDEFAVQTRVRISSAACRILVIGTEMAALADLGSDDVAVVTVDQLGHGLGRPGAEAFEPPEPDPSALAILQFTSGSTSDPKGVMLPHAQVVANLESITAGAAIDFDNDVVVSWLPLYHDMGLIGLLGTPMTTGIDLIMGSPQDFLSSPGRWMEWMSEHGGTLTAGPNFAYALASRAIKRQSGLDLSRWRLALNGAEPVDPGAVEAFCESGARHGLDHRAMFCVYGMAEATLAISFPDPGAGMSTDWVNKRALEKENAAVPATPGDPRARRLARVGRPLSGIEVRVTDPDDGRCRAEREVGEIEIRGVSVTPGYFRRPDATAEAFRDGWLRTGDLGYLVEGELVVCGRAKDMIIVGGRNVFPEDVERAVANVEGVRRGNVIAFSVDGRKGRETLVVVAETREGDSAALKRSIANHVRRTEGLSLEDVVLVGPGSLPKTSSGKLQRSLCRSRYLGAQLEPV